MKHNRSVPSTPGTQTPGISSRPETPKHFAGLMTPLVAPPVQSARTSPSNSISESSDRIPGDHSHGRRAASTHFSNYLLICSSFCSNRLFRFVSLSLSLNTNFFSRPLKCFWKPTNHNSNSQTPPTIITSTTPSNESTSISLQNQFSKPDEEKRRLASREKKEKGEK